ncbi:MAG: hypothetical protein J1F22_04345 [Lachnospiraceae bacterium]|nr:hypothetical protein [Lachnospiraceae bacterium]
MGISGISGVSGIQTFYPIYNASPVNGVTPTDAVTRGTDGTAQGTVDGAKNGTSPDRVEQKECQTCKNRKYVDGSNENVSFKTPTHISPNNAAAAVMGHEKEHLANAIAEGSQKNKQLVSASITLHTSVCPECGRVYVSGGVTHTQIRTMKNGQENKNPYAKQQANLDYLMSAGRNMDIGA